MSIVLLKKSHSGESLDVTSSVGIGDGNIKRTEKKWWADSASPPGT